MCVFALRVGLDYAFTYFYSDKTAQTGQNLQKSLLAKVMHFCRGCCIPGNSAAKRIPAAPSLVVFGLNVSARTVTEQKGRASAMQTAVERPITPAPTTTILTLFILDRPASPTGSGELC